jgi:hypothetical protein
MLKLMQDTISELTVAIQVDELVQLCDAAPVGLSAECGNEVSYLPQQWGRKHFNNR